MTQHTLSVLVENSPGVLARVASLFSRRGYNIDSLAVGPTENPEISRMTIVLNLEGHALDQVSAQLFKLVNVIGIQEMKSNDSRQAELLYVKVKNAASLAEIVKENGGAIIESNGESSIIQAVGSPKGLEKLLLALQPIGIREVVQSGSIAIELGEATLVERTIQETGIALSESHSQTEDYQN